MSESQDVRSSQDRECIEIMHWLLAIAEVVNTGGRLAARKATQKLLKEWVETYGPEACWRGIKHFSKTFGMVDALGVEALFQSHPDLPNLLKTKEGQQALSRWYEENSARVNQARRLFHAMGRLMPITTTSKFAEGAANAKQREVLSKVSDILAKEGK